MWTVFSTLHDDDDENDYGFHSAINSEDDSDDSWRFADDEDVPEGLVLQTHMGDDVSQLDARFFAATAAKNRQKYGFVAYGDTTTRTEPEALILALGLSETHLISSMQKVRRDVSSSRFYARDDWCYFSYFLG